MGVSLSLASALLRPDCAALKELDRLPVKFELAIGQNGQVGRLALVANAAPPACPWAFALPPVLKIASSFKDCQLLPCNAEYRVI